MENWGKINEINKFIGALTKLNVVQNATLKEKNIQYGDWRSLRFRRNVSILATLSPVTKVTAENEFWNDAFLDRFLF